MDHLVFRVVPYRVERLDRLLGDSACHLASGCGIARPLTVGKCDVYNY